MFFAPYNDYLIALKQGWPTAFEGLVGGRGGGQSKDVICFGTSKFFVSKISGFIKFTF